MKAVIIYTIMLIALFYLSDAAAQEKQNFGPDDFEWTMELTGNAGSLLSLNISETIYRGIKRPDLGDIRVYDAEGNPAPFLIRTVRGTVETLPEKTVPLLAWDKNTQRFSASGIEINTSELAVTITGQTEEERGSVYLADLSGLETAPSKLILEFEKNDYFNALLHIRSSDDLAEWKDYDKIQAAVFYDSPGTDKNEFDIPQGRYLLLNFDRNIPGLHSGLVHFDPAEIPLLGETHFSGTKSADGKKILYNTVGCFPAAKIKFILSQPDSIRVTVRESAQPENSRRWSSIRETVIYRIQTPEKEPSMNGALDAAGFSGPYWEIEALGEQVFTEIPVMSLLWETRELVFLARGQGPWILAYGNENCEQAVSFLSIGNEEIFPAITGKLQYTEQVKDGDFGSSLKQIILWSVLVLSTTVLSGLAVYIIKSVKNGEQTIKNHTEDRS